VTPEEVEFSRRERGGVRHDSSRSTISPVKQDEHSGKVRRFCDYVTDMKKRGIISKDPVCLRLISVLI
jgi:hypothetical protein